jgi:AraC-like DNA-binding protein
LWGRPNDVSSTADPGLVWYQELHLGLQVILWDLLPTPELIGPVGIESSVQLWIMLAGAGAARVDGYPELVPYRPGHACFVQAHRPVQRRHVGAAEDRLSLLDLRFSLDRVRHALGGTVGGLRARLATPGTEDESETWLVQFPIPPAMAGLAGRMLRAPPAGRACDLLMLEAQAIELLSLAVNLLETAQERTQPAAATLSRRDRKRLRDAHDLMLERLDHPWTLREIARFAGMNENKLKCGFRALFGSSVYAYLQQRRMETAAQLLRQGDASIIEVALAVGYSSPSHFSKLFRRYFGTAPRQFGQAQ